jgi:hypothetical protein
VLALSGGSCRVSSRHSHGGGVQGAEAGSEWRLRCSSCGELQQLEVAVAAPGGAAGGGGRAARSRGGAAAEAAAGGCCSRGGAAAAWGRGRGCSLGKQQPRIMTWIGDPGHVLGVADRDGEAGVVWVLGDGRRVTPRRILLDAGVEAPVMSLAYGRELGLLPPAAMGDGESGLANGVPAPAAEGSASGAAAAFGGGVRHVPGMVEARQAHRLPCRFGL